MIFKYLSLQKKSLTEYKHLFDASGSKKDIQNLIWVHFDNVPKKTMSNMVYSDDKLAAIYATMPVYFQVNGCRVLAVQSLDTITSSEFRGQGLFVSAASNQYEECLNQGVSHVYGFPNGSSVHGFKKHLGWKMLDPLPFIFKPLRAGYFINKIFGSKVGELFDFPLAFKKKIRLPDNFLIESVETFDKRIDQLWERFSNTISISILRDSAYLNWRYVSKPNENYKILQIIRGRDVVGVLVYCMKDKHGGKIGYIMEFMYDPDCEMQAKMLLNVAINDMISNKMDTVLSWCFDFSPNFSTYKKAGFNKLPAFLRPIELHFGALTLNGNEKILSERKGWYISYSDSDTV